MKTLSLGQIHRAINVIASRNLSPITEEQLAAAISDAIFNLRVSKALNGVSAETKLTFHNFAEAERFIRSKSASVGGRHAGSK